VGFNLHAFFVGRSKGEGTWRKLRGVVPGPINDESTLFVSLMPA
jgi:hypothetical protein